MWLLDYVTRNSLKDRKPSKGEITSSDSNSVCVNSFYEHRDIEVVVPYGVYYNPPSKEESVVLPLNSSCVSIGVVQKAVGDLEPGEIMLKSKGGAKIVLKNDGSVEINGKVF